MNATHIRSIVGPFLAVALLLTGAQLSRAEGQEVGEHGDAQLKGMPGSPEETVAPPEEEMLASPLEPMSSALLGQITGIDGEFYTFQNEDGSEPVRLPVASEITSGGHFKAGDQVIASVSPTGQVTAMTSLLTADASPLPHEKAQ